MRAAHRRVAAAIAVLAAMVTLAACGSDETSSGPQRLDLKIGDLVPLTGIRPVRCARHSRRRTWPSTRSARRRQGRRAAQGHDHARGLPVRAEGGGRLAEKFVRGRLELPGRPVGRGPGGPGRDEGRDPEQGAPDHAGGQRRRAVEGRGPRIPEPRRAAGPASGATRSWSCSTTSFGRRTRQEGERRRARSQHLRQGADEGVRGRVDREGRPDRPRGDVSAGRDDLDDKAKGLAAGDPDAWVFFDFADTYGRIGKRSAEQQGRRSSLRSALSGPTASRSAAREHRAAATTACAAWRSAPRTRGQAAEEFDKRFKARGPAKRQTFDAQKFDAVVLCYLSAVAAGSTNGRDMAGKVREVSAPPGRKYTWLQLDQADQGARGGPGHRLRGRLRPDRHERRTATRPPASTTSTSSRAEDAARRADRRSRRVGRDLAAPPSPGARPRCPAPRAGRGRRPGSSRPAPRSAAVALLRPRGSSPGRCRRGGAASLRSRSSWERVK